MMDSTSFDVSALKKIWQWLKASESLHVTPIQPSADFIRRLLHEYPTCWVLFDASQGHNVFLEIGHPTGAVYLLILAAPLGLAERFAAPSIRAEQVMLVLETLRETSKSALPPLPSLPSEAGQALMSARELEVLGFVARGFTNSEIAQALSISVNTVGFHLKNIFLKLNVTNRTEASRWYFVHFSSLT